MTDPTERSSKPDVGTPPPGVTLRPLVFSPALAPLRQQVFTAEYDHEEEPGAPLVRLTVALVDPAPDAGQELQDILGRIRAGFTLVDPDAVPDSEPRPTEGSGVEPAEGVPSVEAEDDTPLNFDLTLVRYRPDNEQVAAFVVAGLTFTTEVAEAPQLKKASTFAHTWLSLYKGVGHPLGRTIANYKVFVTKLTKGVVKVRPDKGKTTSLKLHGLAVGSAKSVAVTVTKVTGATYEFTGYFI